MADTADLEISMASDGAMVLRLSGPWTLAGRIPDLAPVLSQIDRQTPSGVRFDASDLRAWDSTLLTFVLGFLRFAQDRHVEIDLSGLPSGARGLLDLATAVPPQHGTGKGRQRFSFLEILGNEVLDFCESTGRVFSFIGDVAISMGRLLTGRAQFRRSDLWLHIEQAGVDALPIVSLLSLLQGLTMAFLGAAQLKLFGAQIFVANLIGLSMASEVAAVMTAIIMAGRTSAAYAAAIGAMQVNQEVDALTTLGISATDFLVLPRILALVLMMPLLYVYANVVGMFGGGLIAVTSLGLTPQQFMNQLFAAVPLSVFVVGLEKSAIFGLLVAVCGCLQGIHCGRSAAAVGNATTSAVVTSIVAIIVANGVFAIVHPPLG